MEELEAMQARHRREQRELQNRITGKKKNATKKTRKGIVDECASMERALREKQEAELRALGGDGGEHGGEEDEARDTDAAVTDKAAEAAVDGISAQLAGTALDTRVAPPDTRATPPAKRNRQRERLARRAAERAESQEQAAAEAATMVDHAAVERAALAPLLARSGRVEHAIRADGHCLFAAVADQLAAAGRAVAPLSGDGDVVTARARTVRRAAADYMAAHADDFAPFYAGGAGQPTLAGHIARIRDTAEWGGQLELQALAGAYDVRIRVLHDGRSEEIAPAGAAGSDEDARPTLWLVYYRHGFGLGEHYNSLRATATEATV